jgi:hypothetical protein
MESTAVLAYRASPLYPSPPVYIILGGWLFHMDCSESNLRNHLVEEAARYGSRMYRAYVEIAFPPDHIFYMLLWNIIPT